MVIGSSLISGASFTDVSISLIAACAREGAAVFGAPGTDPRARFVHELHRNDGQP